MAIQIEAEYWPIAAGCIGLAKLFSEEELPRTATGITLHESILDNLAEKYIRALIEMFNVSKRDVRRFSWYAHQAEKEPAKTKQFAADLRKVMNEQYKKVVKYFPETQECKRLNDLLERLKEVTTPEQYLMIRQAVEQYNEIMSTPFINDKLSLNIAKSEALIPFFGQTSILQKTFYSKSIEEHILQIEKDFIRPAKLEFLFHKKRSENISKEEILNFLKEHQEYKPLKDLIKPLKDLDKEGMDSYLAREVLHCSFIEGLLATQAYEEMTFSPLSFSKSKAANFNWNFDNQLPVPMSALARLIMFVAPYGMAFYSRRLGDEHANEYLTFSGLILTQKHFSEVIRENITYQKLRREGSSFGEAIVGILNESVNKAIKLNDKSNSYFFLEMYSNYDMKKTLLDYYHMPGYLVKYFAKYGNTLKLLFHKELRDAFFRAILKGIDPKEVLFDYLRIAIKEPIHAQGAYHATRERKRILEAKRLGDEDMDNFDKVITYVYYRGVDLQKQMVKDRLVVQENEPYRATGRKKIEGIAYRLLNSAKAGNKNAFMDTIFRIHMAAGLPVPSVFIDSFKEDGLDFESIASSFIAGLLGQEKVEKEGAKSNE